MPSKTKDTSTVSVVHGICCGLDVHKKNVSACLLWSDSSGAEQCEVKEFETFTDDLFRLKEWLKERECPVVAMESTGPYWTPIHNILEGFFQVILVNARHMRNVPARKTDLSDSRWLAGLLRHGLLKAAFILILKSNVRFGSRVIPAIHKFIPAQAGAGIQKRLGPGFRGDDGKGHSERTLEKCYIPRNTSGRGPQNPQGDLPRNKA